MSPGQELSVIIARIENEGFMQGFIVFVSPVDAKTLFADLESNVSFCSQRALTPPLTTSI